jgi:hypothetical protein
MRKVMRIRLPGPDQPVVRRSLLALALSLAAALVWVAILESGVL